ncbi:MAG: hypothetical protein GF308_00670 [Candidatus Heimdallarchaeota archaeon]|nr:hypothetical protein [Candidatus Heimdallarchaeota archaeon]
MQIPPIVQEFIKEITTFAFQKGILIIPEWDYENNKIYLRKGQSLHCPLGGECLDQQKLQLKIQEMGFPISSNSSCSDEIEVTIDRTT